MEKVKYKHLTSEFELSLKTIELTARHILPFVSRSIPDFPSHGIDHSTNIIKHIDNFIDTYLKDSMLNDEEIYLLYLAAWLHDIGNLLDRDKHHILSAEIIKNSPYIKSKLDTDTLDKVGWIALSHSSKYDINNVPEKVKGKSNLEIRLRFISSIFRIIDACEIIGSNTKCPIEVYEIISTKLPPDSREYWEAHLSIIGIRFENPIIYVEVKDEEKSKILTMHVSKEIKLVENVLLDYRIAIPNIKVTESMKPYKYDDENEDSS